MSGRFSIDKRDRSGNLHISISGEFDGMCAWELLKIISRQETLPGRVFVSTGKLDRVLPNGAAIFKAYMERKPIRTDWLYFKGQKGFQIAPDGSRVLILNRCGHRTGLPFGKTPHAPLQQYQGKKNQF